jgi:hypothetical protein
LRGLPAVFDRFRYFIRQQLSLATERTYAYWARQFILFHGRRRPEELGSADVARFPSYLVEWQCAANARALALNTQACVYQRFYTRSWAIWRSAAVTFGSDEVQGRSIS